MAQLWIPSLMRDLTKVLKVSMWKDKLWGMSG